MAQGENRQSTQAKGKRQRRRADEHVPGRHRQHFPGVAVRYGQQVTVKMHGCFRRAGSTRSKGQQGYVIPARIDRVKLDWLVEG